jgi:bifunctional DNA-binding transcriptional regulator/antitoxin component of YhaV-PrlF toxin-antitoxin module
MSREYEIRTIQALTGERSLTLVLPKQYAIDLGLRKGEFVKVSQDDGKIIVEKMDKGEQ